MLKNFYLLWSNRWLILIDLVIYSIPQCEPGCVDNSDCLSDDSRPHCDIGSCTCQPKPCPIVPNDMSISTEKSRVNIACICSIFQDARKMKTNRKEKPNLGQLFPLSMVGRLELQRKHLP